MVRIPSAKRSPVRHSDNCEYHCYVCGRPIGDGITPPEWWVEVVNGGSHATEPGDEPADRSDAGYMGCQPIGPECRKRVGAAAFRHPAYNAVTL